MLVAFRQVFMLRMAAFSAILGLAMAAQAQTIVTHGAPASVLSPTPDGIQHGAPASVLSPTPDGVQHGAPASVLSPTPLPFGVNPPLASRKGFRFQGPGHRFGNPHVRKHVFIPIPVFYPIYSNYDPYQPADPNVQEMTESESQAAAQADSATSEDELRLAHLQGARDALKQQKGDTDSRYGEHYLDSREHSKPTPRAQEEQPKATEPPREDNSPATIFIFKDGNKIETKNFAIMGQTLYDFSGPILKKVSLADLDKAATIKADDDRGINVKLP